MFFQLGWWHVHRGPLLIWNKWPGKNISRHMVQLSCLSVGHCDSTLWPNHLCRFGAAGLAIGLGAGWPPFWVCALEALSSPPLLKEPLWQEAVCSLPGARRPGSCDRTCSCAICRTWWGFPSPHPCIRLEFCQSGPKRTLCPHQRLFTSHQHRTEPKKRRAQFGICPICCPHAKHGGLDMYLPSQGHWDCTLHPKAVVRGLSHGHCRRHGTVLTWTAAPAIYFVNVISTSPLWPSRNR